MSRGFVKEDDQEEIPLVPPRADLPIWAENWVTPAGMEALQQERADLISEQEKLDPSHEREYRIAFNHLNARLQLLNGRMASAKIIDTARLSQDEVHFGATVTFKNLNNNLRQTFQLVGVDEANISKGKLAFTTPLAKALMNSKVGEKVTLQLGDKTNIFEILSIGY